MFTLLTILLALNVAKTSPDLPPSYFEIQGLKGPMIKKAIIHSSYPQRNIKKTGHFIFNRKGYLIKETFFKNGKLEYKEQYIPVNRFRTKTITTFPNGKVRYGIIKWIKNNRGQWVQSKKEFNKGGVIAEIHKTFNRKNLLIQTHYTKWETAKNKKKRVSYSKNITRDEKGRTIKETIQIQTVRYTRTETRKTRHSNNKEVTEIVNCIKGKKCKVQRKITKYSQRDKYGNFKLHKEYVDGHQTLTVTSQFFYK